jgi:hypothetical protein
MSEAWNDDSLPNRLTPPPALLLSLCDRIVPIEGRNGHVPT